MCGAATPKPSWHYSDVSNSLTISQVSCFDGILLVLSQSPSVMLDFTAAGTHWLLPEELARENFSRSENTSAGSIQGRL